MFGFLLRFLQASFLGDFPVLKQKQKLNFLVFPKFVYLLVFFFVFLRLSTKIEKTTHENLEKLRKKEIGLNAREKQLKNEKVNFICFEYLFMLKHKLYIDVVFGIC